ncbi:MAG TPA: A24 family peptidase [Labilithrix sp.]|nr:A24 family peptidase [Labilithrix sp.]
MLYFLFAATLLTGCAAWTDWRTGHIPNKLTLAGFAGGVLAHFARGAYLGGLRGGVEQAGFALGGALLCALVPLFMFHKGGMGGGDVKLFAAIGALLQPLGGLEAETYAFVAAAVLAPMKLAYEGTLTRTVLNTLALVTNPFRAPSKRKAIPEAAVAWFRLGPAIFLGTASTLVIHFHSWSLRP